MIDISLYMHSKAGFLNDSLGFGVCPKERFLDPSSPPNQFLIHHLNDINIYFVFFQSYVRTGLNSRAERSPYVQLRSILENDFWTPSYQFCSWPRFHPFSTKYIDFVLFQG